MLMGNLLLQTPQLVVAGVNLGANLFYSHATQTKLQHGDNYLRSVPSIWLQFASIGAIAYQLNRTIPCQAFTVIACTSIGVGALVSFAILTLAAISAQKETAHLCAPALDHPTVMYINQRLRLDRFAFSLQPLRNFLKKTSVQKYSEFVLKKSHILFHTLSVTGLVAVTALGSPLFGVSALLTWGHFHLISKVSVPERFERAIDKINRTMAFILNTTQFLAGKGLTAIVGLSLAAIGQR